MDSGPAEAGPYARTAAVVGPGFRRGVEVNGDNAALVESCVTGAVGAVVVGAGFSGAVAGTVLIWECGLLGNGLILESACFRIGAAERLATGCRLR